VVVSNLAGPAVSLALDLAKKAGLVTGTISNGKWVAALLGDRSAYSPANPAPQAGNYKMFMTVGAKPVDSQAGHGHATVKVNADGSLIMCGSRMARGSARASRFPGTANGR
jgi:hypothetical protein